MNNLWDNLMEVIKNHDDISNHRHSSGRLPDDDGDGVRTADHLQPILEYLRDGSVGGPREPVSSNGGDDDVDVIDLTRDEEPPSSATTSRRIVDLIDLIDDPSGEGISEQTATGGGSNTDTSGAGNDADDDGDVRRSKKHLLAATQEGAGSSRVKDEDAENGRSVSLLCPVCLDSFEMIKEENERSLISTACGHVFCSSCMDDVMKKHKTCPTCRHAIRKASLRPIFL